MFGGKYSRRRTRARLTPGTMIYVSRDDEFHLVIGWRPVPANDARGVTTHEVLTVGRRGRLVVHNWLTMAYYLEKHEDDLVVCQAR